MLICAHCYWLALTSYSPLGIRESWGKGRRNVKELLDKNIWVGI